MDHDWTDRVDGHRGRRRFKRFGVAFLAMTLLPLASIIALSSPASAAVPGTPTGVTAVAGNGQVVVSWSAPGSNGGKTITAYNVQANDGTSVVGTCVWSTGPLTCTVTGLTNGTPVRLRVRATNADGNSPYSSYTSYVTPATVPGAPTGVTGTSGNAQVAVSWSAPGSNGGSAVTGYTVTSSPGSFTCTTASLTCTVSGLTNGTAYTFTVTATNTVGTGAASSPSSAVTPATVPGAPTIGTATNGYLQAMVTWTAPASNGGAPITSYTVTSSIGSHTCTISSPFTILKCAVTGLVNGVPYTFTVKANNSAGASAASAASNSVTASNTATVPSAPLSVTAVAGNAQATVSWLAPDNPGNSAGVTGYTVTSSPGSFTCTTASLTCTVSGLTNGTAYTFTVKATNAVGNSAASSASSAVTPVTVPGAPTGVTGTAGNAQVAVSWSAPGSNGGSAITGYTVTSSPGSFTCTTASLTCTVSGLTNGTAYTFTVTATNGVGTGAASSASSAVTPATVPGAPTGVTGTAGNAQVAVSWSAPGSNGGSAITGYTVTSSPGSFTCTTASLTCTVSGLTNGTAYTFTVTATNGVGTGAASSASASVTPATVPDAPTGVTGVRGNTQVAVSWSAPGSNGGSAVTGYTVTSSPGSFTCTTASLTCTVSGLTNGTAYTFTVTATNAVGTGLASSASASVTPATVPDAPTGVTGTAGDTQVAVAWSAPGSNGGSAITGYTVTSSPGSFTCTTASLTCTVSGLTNGTAYTFTVTATNAVGTGLASSASASVTPATVPDAPTGVTGTAGDTQVAVSWSAPGSNGGSAITGYTVTSSPGSFTCTTASLTCTVTGLTNGTPYTFTVTATNSVGTGAASTASASVTPDVVPGPPTAVTGTEYVDSQVPVTWTAPADNGGTPITGYTATASPGGATCTTSGATSCTVTGLTNGTPYTFTVTATNAAGTGSSSDPSAAVIPATLPDAPTLVSATLGNMKVTLDWTAPASNGGLPIKGYLATCSAAGDVRITVVNKPFLSTTVAGLTAGETYSCTVAATQLATRPYGPDSAPLAIVADKLPGVPTNVVAAPDDGQFTVSWTPPVSNGGSAVLDYSLDCTYLVAGVPTPISVPGPIVSPVTVTGVTNGVAYTCKLKATNAIGTGAAITKSVTPRTTPGTPTSVVWSAGAASALVSFVPPATTGGAAITGYTLTCVNDAGSKFANLAASATSGKVSGLTNGATYYCSIAARNAAGTGVSSAVSDVHPVALPKAPTGLTATATSGGASLSFTAPSGSTVTGYTATCTSGVSGAVTPVSVSGASSPLVLSGLTAGDLYVCNVRATNSVGQGPPSANATVTPLA